VTPTRAPGQQPWPGRKENPMPMPTFTPRETRRLRTLAQHLPDGIASAQARLAEIQQQITDLQTLGVCTGVAYWRDAGSSKTPKLYINHDTDTPCPVHGRPAPGHRIRHYVGTNPHTQTAALAAIQRLQQAQSAQNTHDGWFHRLHKTLHLLTQIYADLEASLPRDGDDPAS